MENKRFNLIIFIILILLITVPLFMVENGGGKNTLPGEEKRGTAKKLKGVHLTIINEEKTLKWELKSDEVKHFEDQYYLELFPIQVDAIELEDNREIYSFTADAGEYRVEEGTVNLPGPVEIDKGDNILKTEDIIWTLDDNLIRGGEITLEGPGYTLTGSEFKAEGDLAQITVLGSEQEQAHFIWEERDHG